MPTSRTTPTSITVRDLTERLLEEDPDAQVVFACDFGDIGHTQQVFFVHGDLDEQELEQSGYADSGWAIRTDDDKDDEDDEKGGSGPAFLVLS